MSKLKFFVSVAAACFAASASAWAQQTQPPANGGRQSQQPNHTAAPAANDEVVVTAPSQGNVTQIDRRVYAIHNDPIAQTSSSLEILGRLPGVTVSSGGALRLLGDPGVSIQIDGHPLPSGAAGTALLRGMTGDQIDRIEVMTNPSAQYSPQGTAGIINIITRRRFSQGISGSAQIGADNLGSYQANFSPNWTAGPWTLGLVLGFAHNTLQTTSSRDRQNLVSGMPSGSPILEDGSRDIRSDAPTERLTIIHRPNNNTTTTFGYEHTGQTNQFDQTLFDSDPSGPLFTERVETPVHIFNDRATFENQWNGPRGQSLDINASLTNSGNRNNNAILIDPTIGPATSFFTSTNSISTYSNAKIDYARQLGASGQLKLGASLDASDVQTDDTAQAQSSPPTFQALGGRQQTTAAYSTVQFTLGTWTLLPGLRVEDFRQEVKSSGGEADRTDLDAYPTIHMRRALPSTVQLDLSFTTRITRPAVSLLDPALHFFDATHATVGNPDLQPVMTHAYEAHLSRGGAAGFDLTFYDRTNEGEFAQLVTLNGAGVTVSTITNAGTSERRGANIAVGRSLNASWSYSLNLDLRNHVFNVLMNGLPHRESEFDYDGKLQLIYHDRPNNNRLQIDLNYTGPNTSLQTHNEAVATADLTWRHKLTERAFVVLNINDVFDSSRNRSVITTDDFIERDESIGAGRTFKLALTYQFNSAPSH